MNTHLLVQLLGVLICVNLFELSEARTSDELRITLPNGSKLVGRTFRSHDGRPIKAFLSVPYAKPPLGPLRFKVIALVKIFSIIKFKNTIRFKQTSVHFWYNLLKTCLNQNTFI